jgi:hypothetical protein
MLLFVLRDNFREAPYTPSAAPSAGACAPELLIAGLFLSGWCVLRLAGSHAGSFAVDSALAVPCLAFGLWAILRSARALSVSIGRGRPRECVQRAVNRSHRRRQRVERANRGYRARSS